MKWSVSTVAATFAVVLAPLTVHAQLDEKNLKGRDVMLRGCVQQGAKPGHYVLAQFSHVPAAGQPAIPKVLEDGRGVFFWLEDLPKLDKYFNQMVEVTGEFLGTKDGQTEPKFQDGQQVVEIEGPGRDVDLTANEAREIVGTAGVVPTKILLVRVDVDEVRQAAGSCN